MTESDAFKAETLSAFHDLKQKLKYAIKDVYQIDVTGELWICDITLMHVVNSISLSHRDMRNQYTHGISILKHISLTASWLIKLKPINNVELYKHGSKVSVPDINERVAICLAMHFLGNAVRDGKLREIISPSPENITSLNKIVDFYYTGRLYRKVSDDADIKKGGDVENSQKINELIHNVRYKKFTSVNIYEILMHLIIPYKAMKARDG